MPILNADRAHNVIVIKRGKGAGYSGIENALFYGENTRMLYGSAQQAIAEVITAHQDPRLTRCGDAEGPLPREGAFCVQVPGQPGSWATMDGSGALISTGSPYLSKMAVISNGAPSALTLIENFRIRFASSTHRS